MTKLVMITSEKRLIREKKYPVPPQIAKQIPNACVSAHAARLLGISKTELRQRVKDGIYKTIKDRRGWHWFDRDALDLSVRTGLSGPLSPQLVPRRVPSTQSSAPRPVSMPKVPYSGSDAKRVFDALADGGDTISIVRKFSIHPEAVENIQACWYRVQGQLLLTQAHKNAIEALPLPGERPIRDADHLVALITRSLGAMTPCARCGRNHAKLCYACAQGDAFMSGHAGGAPPSTTTGANGTLIASPPATTGQNGTNGAPAPQPASPPASLGTPSVKPE